MASQIAETVQVLIVSLSVAAVLVALVAWGVIANNNDHNFDVTCINKGKAIRYATIPGDDYSYKECK